MAGAYDFMEGGGMGLVTCEFHEDFKLQLRDHELRIIELEKSDEKFTLKFQYLCEKIDALIGWLKAIFLTLLGGGLGFFIWYIQHLGV